MGTSSPSFVTTITATVRVGHSIFITYPATIVADGAVPHGRVALLPPRGNHLYIRGVAAGRVTVWARLSNGEVSRDEVVVTP